MRWLVLARHAIAKPRFQTQVTRVLAAALRHGDGGRVMVSLLITGDSAMPPHPPRRVELPKGSSCQRTSIGVRSWGGINRARAEVGHVCENPVPSANQITKYPIPPGASETKRARTGDTVVAAARS